MQSVGPPHLSKLLVAKYIIVKLETPSPMALFRAIRTAEKSAGVVAAGWARSTWDACEDQSMVQPEKIRPSCATKATPNGRELLLLAVCARCRALSATSTADGVSLATVGCVRSPEALVVFSLDALVRSGEGPRCFPLARVPLPIHATASPPPPKRMAKS